ncbi:MAG TPA: hypothetical protein VIH18_03120 [Candidatus Binatia bacterium]|jgi:hypothetical protein
MEPLKPQQDKKLSGRPLTVKKRLPLRGLTFVAIVYSALGFYLVLHLIHAA